MYTEYMENSIIGGLASTQTSVPLNIKINEGKTIS